MRSTSYVLVLLVGSVCIAQPGGYLLNRDRVYRVPSPDGGYDSFRINYAGEVLRRRDPVPGPPSPWTSLGTPNKGAGELTIARAPNGEFRIFAVGKGKVGVYQLEGPGNTWTEIYGSPIEQLSVGIDKQGKSFILARSNKGMVYYRGPSTPVRTWNVVGQKKMESVQLVGNDSGTGLPVFLARGTDGRLYESRSDGKEWERLQPKQKTPSSLISPGLSPAPGPARSCVYAYSQISSPSETKSFRKYAENRMNKMAAQFKGTAAGVQYWQTGQPLPPLEPIHECTHLYVIYNGHSSPGFPWGDFVKRAREMYPNYRELVVENAGCLGMFDSQSVQSIMTDPALRPKEGQLHAFWGSQLITGPVHALHPEDSYFSWYGIQMVGAGEPRHMLMPCHTANPCNRTALGRAYYCRNQHNQRVLYQCTRTLVPGNFYNSYRYAWEVNATTDANEFAHHSTPKGHVAPSFLRRDGDLAM